MRELNLKLPSRAKTEVDIRGLPNYLVGADRGHIILHDGITKVISENDISLRPDIFMHLGGKYIALLKGESSS